MQIEGHDIAEIAVGGCDESKDDDAVPNVTKNLASVSACEPESACSEGTVQGHIVDGCEQSTSACEPPVVVTEGTVEGHIVEGRELGCRSDWRCHIIKVVTCPLVPCTVLVVHVSSVV